MSDRKDPAPDNLPLIICITVGGLFLAALTVISLLTDIPAFPATLIFLVIYIAAVAISAHISRAGGSFHIGEGERASIGVMLSSTLRDVADPMVISSAEGRIVWANAAAAEHGSPIGLELSELMGASLAEITSELEGNGLRVLLGEAPYRVHAYPMETQDRRYYLLTLSPVAALEAAEARADDELAVVAYVALDNLEELAKYARVSYRESANRAEEILRTWAERMDAIIREYDRDKFLVIMPQKRLADAIRDRFSVLDDVREVKAGESGMSLTVSMGISASGGTLAEREREAAVALEMALQRGGDQVALRRRTGPGQSGYEYFGGRTKSVRESTKVDSRVVYERLAEILSSAGNVLIMGHKNPDFDCIGASVGLARIAALFTDDVRIISDRANRNFTVCTEGLRHELANDGCELFIDAEDGLEMIRSDTVLIVTDVNNFAISESPEIAANAFRTVVIDHHRKAGEFQNEPELVYIEPSASSACELVAEMLGFSPIGQPGAGQDGLSRREADIMLAGIMVDTQDFTRSTTARTFSAALYLRECGASSEIARTFFYEDLTSYITESRLGAEICIYRSRIAIAVGRGTAADIDPDDTAAMTAARGADRVTASKAADKMLTVRGVAAAFVLLETDGEVMISARSDGSFNVQLVLEQLGGGGHFDAAGAQVSGDSIKDVLCRLKACIDEYLG